MLDTSTSIHNIEVLWSTLYLPQGFPSTLFPAHPHPPFLSAPSSSLFPPPPPFTLPFLPSFPLLPQATIVDARGHLVGRLASIVAKQLLLGNKVVIVRCEEAILSGGLTRQKMKYERFLHKHHNVNPSRCGPWHFRAPSRMVWRVIRGMMPHKTARGAEAMGRLACFEGIPAPYDTQKRMVVADALKVVRMQHGRKFCRLGDLAESVGWRHGQMVANLEEKRKEKSAVYYAAKQKQVLKMRAAYKKATV